MTAKLIQKSNNLPWQKHEMCTSKHTAVR